MNPIKSFDIPVLLIVFNRPHLVQSVFDVIKTQKPKYLYVASDGPRLYKEGEKESVEEARNIINQIDWDCEVKTFFRDNNEGPGKGVASAIVWFFENVEKGIVLEEDCLPHPDFFPYCEELLVKYEDNSQIMFIGGNNYQEGMKRGKGSYYFSAYPHIWGWAAWKRTLDNYSFTLENYPTKEFKKVLKRYFSLWTERQVWLDKFLLMKKKYGYNTWDYQLRFSIWRKGGLSIIPNVNLVSNTGFGEGAVNCTDENHKHSNMTSHEIMPLIHPREIKRDFEADKFSYFRNDYKSPLRLLYRFVRRILIKNKWNTVLSQK